MTELLSRREVQAFLAAHEKTEPSRLAIMKNLPASLPEGLTAAQLASQLKARQKAKDKLPSWYSRDGIVFPHGVALEQCSSETTACWKAKGLKGKGFADLTGGTAVDSWALSGVFDEGIMIEPDAERCQLAAHNLQLLGATNIRVLKSNATEFLKPSREAFDLIYLDPDRRTTADRAVGFHDCQPNVVQLLPELLERSELVLIKASPMLDIQQGSAQLRNVAEVAVLAVNNEVKELLFYCRKQPGGFCIRAVNLFGKGGEELFAFDPEEEKEAEVEYSEPLSILFEPNAAILKAGAFKSISVRFGLKKLHPNTHLYTAAATSEDFPGRVFQVQQVIPFSSSLSKKKLFGFSRAHVVTRNFPLAAAELQKKLKLQEGDGNYLIGATVAGGKRVLIVAVRIK